MTNTTSPQADPMAYGSGGASLAGYEYQLDVSVLLALDLVLAHQLTDHVVLEPASQEDVEAELDELEPGRVSSSIALDGYRLLVQAKLRTGDAWTVKGIGALLAHGGPKRKAASEHLRDKRTRYLLVTSATLNGASRRLAVHNIGAWPRDNSLPASVAKILPKDSNGRVALLGGQTEEVLSFKIRELLTARFRVPNSRLADCLKILRDQARIRVRGAGHGRWTRQELGAVIREHDGFLTSAPELDRYVFPSQWGALLETIGRSHAALIVGQSGTGKTMATRKLHEVLSQKLPGLTRVHITHGPAQLSADHTPPPVLYDIEDPWGRFDFDPRSRPWNDQLSNHFATATPNRLFVATTRRDVGVSSGALSSVERWSVPLEAEHYGPEARHSLFETRVDLLPSSLQAIARRAEAIVLAELATPLEIQKFFDALATIERDAKTVESTFVQAAIARAHHDAIERTVVEQISERSDNAAAAIVWALLKANGKISLRGLRDIEDGIAEADSTLTDRVTRLIDFFIAARNLRQSEDVVTYYHPRVESGMQQAIERYEALTRRTLKNLVSVLLETDADWGARTSARLLQSLGESPICPKPSSSAQRIIDGWLEGVVVKLDDEFDQHLRLAAAAGSTESTVSELARYLLHGPKDEPFGFMSWRHADRSDAWVTRVRTDERTFPILGHFVLTILPGSSIGYSKNFWRHLERLASGLTPVFIETAKQIARYGVIPSSDAIIAGALEDPDSYEAVLDLAVAARTTSDEESAERQRQRLAITNGEYSDDYAEYLENNDDGYTAGEILEAYVVRMRGCGRWRALLGHRHNSQLRYYWLKDMLAECVDRRPPDSEVGAAVNAAYGTDDETLVWEVLRRDWNERYLPLVLKRLREGHARQDVRQAALACILSCRPSALSELVASVRRDDVLTTLGIAVDLGSLSRSSTWSDRDRSERPNEVEAAIALLPTPFDDVAKAAVALHKRELPALPEDMRTLLATSVGEGGIATLRRFRIDIDQYVPLPIEDDIHWILEHGGSDLDAVAAVKAAARHRLSDVLLTALRHRFARAAACALEAITAEASVPFCKTILEMSSSRSSFIRRSLADVLLGAPHSAHAQTLVQLARDTWAAYESNYSGSQEFPIARIAAEAIEKLESLPSDVAAELQKITSSTRDAFVRGRLLCAIAKLADDDGRKNIIRILRSPRRGALHLDAAISLLAAYENVSEELAGEIGPELLLSREPEAAVRLALLVSVRASPVQVAAVARAVASVPARRSLLLALAWPLASRDLLAAEEVVSLLPPGHVAGGKVLGVRSGPLPPNALDDLGDPEVASAVLAWLALDDARE